MRHQPILMRTHPNIAKLIRLVNIEIMDLKSFCVNYGFMRISQGLYAPTKDIIAIELENEKGDEELNHVFLHEIIHSTGSERRANRDAVVNAGRFVRLTSAEIDTEEATAQIGMYKLALLFDFGISKRGAKKFLKVYLETLLEADLDKADRDSNIAVEWVLGEMCKAPLDSGKRVRCT